MQLSEMPEPLAADIGANVLARLRQMHLEAIPRNYEVIYEALSGANPALVDAIAALGPTPGQDGFDRMADRTLGRGRGERMIESAHASMSVKLDEILRVLKSERSSRERYGEILDVTSQGLRARSHFSQDCLQQVATVMSSVTDTALDSTRRVASTMQDKSAELEAVKAELEQYKKLSETDALTSLPNRRAFDRAMKGVYANHREAMFGALILADIDRFKPVNDKHGHPIGDRILQIVASLFKASMSTNVTVARTGGEEFGLIVTGMSEKAVADLAEEIRSAVEQTPFVNARTGADYGPITVSFGICMASEAKGPDELYRKADRALYASKNGGRNRVTSHSALKDGKLTKGWKLYSSE
ncbi:diguanylate cyclase [Aliihoeflea sp. 40Bstr573]|uniref:GGDEF domain-containing protein n=1 Tax=Aliihoeflea sp. 40Bstr573 TaxID=2696467 RepID=UPI0020950849|nr:GGDEF domain-containing protein [Aliihoeflea sp. 40Bstr573]MCO6388861.1 diguanylate cyclase [Aliihoeflea sp. 40Bstr573]